MRGREREREREIERERKFFKYVLKVNFIYSINRQDIQKTEEVLIRISKSTEHGI